MRFSFVGFSPFCGGWWGGFVLSFRTVAIMGFSHISTSGMRTVGKWFHLEFCPRNLKYCKHY